MTHRIPERAGVSSSSQLLCLGALWGRAGGAPLLLSEREGAGPAVGACEGARPVPVVGEGSC